MLCGEAINGCRVTPDKHHLMRAKLIKLREAVNDYLMYRAGARGAHEPDDSQMMNNATPS